MTPLLLSPLPTARRDDEPIMLERDGFVDEEFVAALMSSPLVPTRQTGFPADLALAADDLDFAGWRLTPRPESNPTQPPVALEVIARRPAPPVVDEPGLGAPHSGNHRWWLAGLAGIISTFLICTLLFSLSSRPGIPFETLFAPKPIQAATPLQLNGPPAKASAEFTKVSTINP